tara:strand:- start:250 stop:624 length:375 start_codon:yes stop_codon:yes gene_type:complete
VSSTKGHSVNWPKGEHNPLQIGYNTKVINKGDLMLFTSDRPVKELNDFVDYVWSFYGEHDDTLYPIFGLTKRDIYNAFFIYQERIEKGDLEYVHYSWGDGDSLDRERVRDIILEQPQFIAWHGG